MLPESKNIQTIADNIRSLENQINALDVEIPSHAAADVGKYLGVDSSGDLEFSKPLPETTGASTGDVLGLTGEGKIPGWITPYTPPEYSTDEVNSGQKWIDGRDIFIKVYSGNFPTMESTMSVNLEATSDYEEYVSAFVRTVTPSGNYITLSNSVVCIPATGQLYIQSIPPTYSEKPYIVILSCLKRAVPSNETKSKKGGTKK